MLLQLLTKACTAGILNALGDGIAQKFVEKNDSFDLKRLGIFAFLVSDQSRVEVVADTYCSLCFCLRLALHYCKLPL